MRNAIFLFNILLICLQGLSQKKISADISIGLLKSIGAEKTKEYNSEINPGGLQYFSKRKFQHPYFNVLGSIYYTITPALRAGLQTGIYTHYLEEYVVTKRTMVTVPLGVVCNYSFLKTQKNAFGIRMTAGWIFMNFKEAFLRYTNSGYFNASLFWVINNNSMLKFGIEKQVDHVVFDFRDLNSSFKEEYYKFRENRLALCISYGFVIN